MGHKWPVLRPRGIGTGRARTQLTFNKMNLIYTAQTKFLAVYITETLKWNTHVESLVNKLSTVSFMIKSLKEIIFY